MSKVDASTLKGWLSDGGEIALVDVREHGQFGEGHLFFAVSLPYSRFEIGLLALVPSVTVRTVLCDNSDGVAERAAVRAAALGYRNLFVLDGGIRAWRDAGYTLYAGVNVQSKTFGELIERHRHTPRLSPQDVAAMRAAADKFVIVDGRPFAEFRKMNIPGGICCPNGELVLRIQDIAPDPATKIVVNCAGRTRSIIGAQTLIEFGIPNPVYALENGTQGWFLAGLELEKGASRRYADKVKSSDIGALRARAQEFARHRGASFVAPSEARSWLDELSRTTYLVDVRSPEEFAAKSIPGFVHAPGGQLIQATDQWIGVKGARILLVDEEEVRAPVIAGWLRQLGHEAYILAGGVAAAAPLDWGRPVIGFQLPELKTISTDDVECGLAVGSVQALDLRPSMTYRKGHIAQARWGIRPKLAKMPIDYTKTLALVADDAATSRLASIDLTETGANDIRVLDGGYQAWCEARLPIEVTPVNPSDTDCIDFLFFVHDRHEGNAEAARQYLAWETGLLDQIDDQERGVFCIAGDAYSLDLNV